MIDVDNFKFFNDTYGHVAGDQVLKGVARTLRDRCRPHDVIGRYGGDEFIVILPNTPADDAARLADKMKEAVALDGYAEPGTERVIPSSITIGCATYPGQATTRNQLLYQADQAMVKAKRHETTASPRSHVRKPSAMTGASFDLLDSMINAVDNKDYYTRAHSEEVTEYALWICEELNFSEDAMRNVRNAGLLHDVGKIGIPDEVLRKPGMLTDEEFELMRQHPVVGEMIVASLPGMRDILTGVRNHHERWDGNGYPDQLAGENIPLLGRLLAVPDTFSAMTTDRPYRKGMNRYEALEKIVAGSGSQFDPDIVTAFVRAFKKRFPAQDETKQAA